MGLYEKYLLPKVIHWACSQKPVMKQRAKVVPEARGRVLEIGLGTGLNLPFYDPEKVEMLWGLEPAPEMRRAAERAVAQAPFEVRFLDLPGEEIPLDDHSVDTVVVTYTLCTIPGTEQALRQMARVLKPGGRLLFTEHGAAPDEAVRKWQERVNPLWQKISGGCNLTRMIPNELESGGFKIETVDTMYLPGWRPATFNYWGSAIPD